MWGQMLHLSYHILIRRGPWQYELRLLVTKCQIAAGSIYRLYIGYIYIYSINEANIGYQFKREEIVAITKLHTSNSDLTMWRF